MGSLWGLWALWGRYGVCGAVWVPMDSLGFIGSLWGSHGALWVSVWGWESLWGPCGLYGLYGVSMVSMGSLWGPGPTADPPPDFLFKFLVIGSAGTGKSCLLHHFIESKCEQFIN